LSFGFKCRQIFCHRPLLTLYVRPAAAARAEALRILEISQENDSYCAKWQMGLGTKMHDQCISDLQELRAKVDKRLADELSF
jgi:hypothetical protein